MRVHSYFNEDNDPSVYCDECGNKVQIGQPVIVIDDTLSFHNDCAKELIKKILTETNQY